MYKLINQLIPLVRPITFFVLLLTLLTLLTTPLFSSYAAVSIKELTKDDQKQLLANQLVIKTNKIPKAIWPQINESCHRHLEWVRNPKWNNSHLVQPHLSTQDSLL